MEYNFFFKKKKKRTRKEFFNVTNMSNASVNKNSKNVSVDLKYAPIWTHFL